MYNLNSKYKTQSLEEKLNDEGVEEGTPLAKKDILLYHPNLHILTYMAALGAALAYGAHNYLVSYAAQIRPDLSCIYPQWMIFLSTYLIFHGASSVNIYFKTGRFWNKTNSAYYQKDPNHFDKISFAVLNLRVLGSVASFANTYFVSRSAQVVEMSPALAMSFGSTSIFMVAILFYFIFKDKVTVRLFIGMMFVLAAVFLVGYSSAIRQTSSEMQTLSLLPVILGLFMGVLNTFNNLCVKILGFRGYSSLRITIDYLFIYSFFPLALYIYEINYGEPYTLENILVISAACLILMIGHFLAIYAFVHGNGGKTAAIVQLQMIFQVGFEMIFDQRNPHTYEIGGLILGLFGAIIMANKR